MAKRQFNNPKWMIEVVDGKYIPKIKDGMMFFPITTGAAELTQDMIDAINTIPNKADRATTLSGYGITDAYTKPEVYTKAEVNSLISSAIRYSGTVNTYDDLANISNPQVGDMYNVLDTDSNYAWDGEAWDKLSETIDLSGKQDVIEDLETIREGAARGALVPNWALGQNKPTYSYSEIQNTPDLSGFLTEETDPTVPSWAKAESKPVYTYAEIQNTPVIPVVPANISAFNNDVGYLTQHQSLSGYATETWVNNQGFLTSFTESDPTVPAWAKESTKPSYNFSEILNVPTTLSGYGIIDAKIENGTITLGNETLTPLALADFLNNNIGQGLQVLSDKICALPDGNTLETESSSPHALKVKLAPDSGLKASSAGIGVSVDGTTIEVNSNGELSVIGGGSGSDKTMLLKYGHSTGGDNLSKLILIVDGNQYSYDYYNDTQDKLNKIMTLVQIKIQDGYNLRVTWHFGNNMAFEELSNYSLRAAPTYTTSYKGVLYIKYFSSTSDIVPNGAKSLTYDYDSDYNTLVPDSI